MHRLSLILITLLSASQAQEYTLEPINVEATQDVFTQTQEDALEKNAFTLQERLKNDVSFDTVAGEKNGEGLSFRGLDDRATGYFEDGIPLYKTTSGETATTFYAPNGTITLSNTAPGATGVSSMGADVQVTTAIPLKSLEALLFGSLSNNDRRAQGYVGSRMGKSYVQLNASTYRMDSYTLSDDYAATPAQPKGERRHSDHAQNDVSLKAGMYVDSHTHIAAKVATSRSHAGVSPNTYTDVTKTADSFQIPIDSYTGIREKNINSLYLYGDFTHENIETTVRGYYDRYRDIYDFYNDNSYTAYLFDGVNTYQDNRLGGSIKTALRSDTHTDAIALVVERNTHRWHDNGTGQSHYSTQRLEASYLAQYSLPNQYLLEGALSCRSLNPHQYNDTLQTFSDYQTKTMFDWQLKLSTPVDKDTVYLSGAHKSRFPTMFEMFPLIPGDVVNPDIKPEQSSNIEVGYENRSFKHTLFSANAYYYNIKDLIINANNTYYNRESAEHYGIETRLKSDIFDRNHLDAGYRYSHTQDSAGERIELIPSHRLTLQDTLDISPGFTATAQYLYTGARYSSYLNVMHKLDDYNMLDLYLNYVRPHGISYRFGVKNLTDEHYEWRYGYPAQGISAFAALQWDL